MVDRTVPLGWKAFVCVLVVVGCSKTTQRPASGEEGAVRETVAAVQAALKAGTADKLWQLLDKESRDDAERAAKAIQATYTKADAKEKSELEQALGLPGGELAGLTGAEFLKTKRFHGKYGELADSKIDKVTPQGDKAVVAYTEPDGDKEKLNLVRQDGQWKVSLAMPSATQP
jgi:hypothetical protein